MANRRSRGRPPHADMLTPAEWRVVEAVRHGMTSRQIAARRGISIDAVKYHIANVLQKLGLATPGGASSLEEAGVARGSALFSQGTQMDQQSTLGPIGQIARHVTDIEAARRWYRDVLGLPHLYSFGDLAFFDCGGTRLFLSIGGSGAPGESNTSTSGSRTFARPMPRWPRAASSSSMRRI